MYRLAIIVFEYICLKSLIIRDLYCKWKCSRNSYFVDEVDSRSKLDLFDYSKLSKPLPYYPIFYIQDCNYYGIGKILFEYAKLPKEYLGTRIHELYLEHGIVIGSLVRVEMVQDYAKLSLTYGTYRKNYILSAINNKTVNLHTIGPYIHYAKSLLSIEELSIHKSKLGKVLLVFPSHSIGSVNADFDADEFCKEIVKRQKGFDSVIVCMYWKDIENNQEVHYQKYGFKIVTAGHRDDIHFLSRLKSIILLSDMVISNSLGTHVGYSLYLNKPNYVYKQKVNHIANNSIGDRLIAMNTKEMVAKTKSQDEERILQVFSEYNEFITKAQLDIANEVWGFNEIKAESELSDILKTLKNN